MQPEEKATGGRPPTGYGTNTHALGTLIEAIVGAVYLDSGHDYTATRDVMERLTLLDRGIMTGADAKPEPQLRISMVKF